MRRGFMLNKKCSETASGSPSRKPHRLKRPTGGPDYIRSFLPRILQSHLDLLSNAEPREMYASGIASLDDSVFGQNEASRHGAPTHYWSVEAVWCFIDITGFSKFSHWAISLFASDISAATECIITHLNSYFSQIMNIIVSFRGDIVSFSGDALLVAWYCNHGTSAAVAASTMCISSILSHCTDYVVCIEGECQPVGTEPLTFHFSVHCGASLGTGICAVTCSMGSRKFVVVGSAIDAACQAAVTAAPGQLAVTDQLKDAIATVECLSGTSFEALPGDFYRVREFSATHSEQHIQMEFIALPRTASSETLCFLGPSFLPDCAFVNLPAQLGRGGELRIVSTVFFGFESNFATQNSDCASAQSAIAKELHAISHVVHRSVAKYRGMCNKIVLDDKGLVVLCLFGLPQHTHENDADRSVLCALTIAHKFAKTSRRVAAGVSRAKVYCGTTGCGTRREYTVLGDGVNVAARLMSVAMTMYSPDENEAFCCVDEATMLSSTSLHLNFSSAQEVSVKKCEASVRVFRAVHCSSKGPLSKSSLRRSKLGLRRRISGIDATDAQSDGTAPEINAESPEEDSFVFVGHHEELAQLCSFVDAMLEEGEAWRTASASTPTLMIVGPPQCGKTCLVNRALALSPHTLENCVRVTAREAQASVPFSAAGQAVVNLIHLEGSEWLQQVTASSTDDLCALLQLVIPLRILPNVYRLPQRELSRDAITNLTYLLATIVESTTKMKLLLVEDAQWVDDWSWATLLALSAHRFPMIICARPGLPEGLRSVRRDSCRWVSRVSSMGSNWDMSSNGSVETAVLYKLRAFPSLSTRRNFERAIMEETVHPVNSNPLSFPAVVEIPPLGEEAIAAMCRSLVDGSTSVDAALVQHMLEKTGGTAGILHDVLLQLRRQRLLGCSESGEVGLVRSVDWSLISSHNSVLEASVMRTVDTLPFIHQVFLSICSVFHGEHFRKQHLFAAARTCLEVPNEFRYIVQDLVQNELLIEVSGSTLRFRAHSCAKDVLYHRMLASERKRFHTIIAHVMEQDISPPHEEIAYHHCKAGSVALSADWLLKGAAAAAKRQCPVEAMRLLDQLPPQAQLRIATSKETVLERHLLFANCCIMLGRLDDARNYLQQARNQLEQQQPTLTEVLPWWRRLCTCLTVQETEQLPLKDLSQYETRIAQLEKEFGKACSAALHHPQPNERSSSCLDSMHNGSLPSFHSSNTADSLPRWSEASSSVSSISVLDCLERSAATPQQEVGYG